MKIKFDVWVNKNEVYKLYHEEFSELDLIMLVKEYLKEKYNNEIDSIEIDEIISR